MRYTALLCLISCLVAAGDKDGHVREQVEVVLHKVTVRLSDKHGAPVKGLTSRDFSLKTTTYPLALRLFRSTTKPLVPNYKWTTTCNPHTPN